MEEALWVDGCVTAVVVFLYPEASSICLIKSFIYLVSASGMFGLWIRFMKIKNYPFVRTPFSLMLHNFHAFERLFLLALLPVNIFLTYEPSIKLFFVLSVFQYSSKALRGLTGACCCGLGGCGG